MYLGKDKGRQTNLQKKENASFFEKMKIRCGKILNKEYIFDILKGTHSFLSFLLCQNLLYICIHFSSF